LIAIIGRPSGAVLRVYSSIASIRKGPELVPGPGLIS